VAILFTVILTLLASVSPNLAAEDIIGTNDVVEVKVFGEEDLSGNFTVRDDGTIKINWVEPIEVAGKTIQDAQEAVRKYLDEKYIVQPKIVLSIPEYVDN